MVHRCDRVIPDLDDRLLPPNAARFAANMRFAASIGDTNLGMTLVNGMAEIEYDIPAGNSLVIGAKEEFESQSVFFALWNQTAANNAIYRLRAGVVEKVIGGAILNFDPDSDVSITTIDGKIYWTDNVNSPRMVNIAKGIASLYPTPLEEWMITQIKRPPGKTLFGPNNVALVQTLRDFSSDYYPLSLSIEQTGMQFSYYYIYDNNEESRLAPWSKPIFRTQLDLAIRPDEFNTYVKANTIVTDVVFVYRLDNDGVVYSIFKVPIANFDVDGRPLSEPPPFGVDIGRIDTPWTLPRIVVSSDITDARFDSVPLLAASNEVAANRINLGNYIIDYNTVVNLNLNCVVNQIVHTEPLPVNSTQYQTFRPSGLYNFGIELLDLWGRTIGVVDPRTISIPNSRYNAVGLTSPQLTAVNPTTYNDDYVNNCYKVNFTISGGALPSWVKYIRLLYSKDQSVSYFHKSVCRIFYWYQDVSGTDILTISSKLVPSPVFPEFLNWPPANLLSEVGEKLNYVLKGYGVEVCSPMPFIFTTGEEQFIRIALEYWYDGTPISGQPQETVEYKIAKQVGNVFYFETDYRYLSPSYYTGNAITNDPITAYVPLWYSVEFLTKKTIPDAIYYQNQQIFDIDQYVSGGNSLSGTIQGDCYISVFKKRFAPVHNKFAIILDGSGDFLRNLSIKSYNGISHEVTGCFVSMNPTNIYSQIWSSDIGQPNVVNENQRQKQILQGITFSNPLIQGTQINGLSKFNSIDTRQAPLENGPIVALVRTSASQREPGVLLAMGNNGVQSFYYDGIQLTNIDGTSNVSTSDRYLASQRPLVGNYGPSSLRNICVTPLGTVYYWSEGIRDWIRYTNAGLEQLGETYQFMNYLRGAAMLASNKVMMTYDQVTDEVILVGNGADALVFSERYKTFQGIRQYGIENQVGYVVRPERGATLSTSTYFFLEGHVWEMGPNVNVANNSFFGELKNPALTVVSNEVPTVVKQWNSIKVIGPKPDLNAVVQTGSAESPLLQSVILPDWWIERKGDWNAAIRRADNTTGGVLNGKAMESRILISSFAWTPNNFDKLNYIEVKSNISIVQ